MEALQEQCQRLLDTYVEQGVFAGVNMLVLKDGRELLWAKAGYADIEAGKAMDRDTICRLYSMSKPVTAAAAMLLVERGELDLAEPLSRYLEGFRNVQVLKGGKYVPAQQPVQLKHLLDMSAGLAYPGVLSESECATAAVFEALGRRMHTPEAMSTVELANALGHCPLAFEPGSDWKYSSCADVLGAVIERVSGRSFGEFLRKEIFEPLEMTHTGFYVPGALLPKVASVYRYGADGRLQRYVGENLGISADAAYQNPFESGGAGLFSSIDDYSHFAQMLLNGGVYRGHRLMREKTIAYMTAAGEYARRHPAVNTWDSMKGYTYRNLMRVLVSPGDALSYGSEGEYGWDGWLGCYFANAPRERLSFLLMMQQTDAGTTELVRKLRNVIFGALS